MMRLGLGTSCQGQCLHFHQTGTTEIPFGFVGRSEDWEVILPSNSDYVCSQHTENRFPMYKVIFKDMGFRLPFSNLRRSVLQWTELSPSQLHPKSYPFMKAFELVCQYLQIAPSKNIFFTLFAVHRGMERGGGQGWVSLRQNKKMFNLFVGKVKSFKEHFLLVRLSVTP